MIKKISILIMGLNCFLCLNASKDIDAVYALIERVTPGYASQYQLELIDEVRGSDIYEIDSNEQKVILRGNNAIALASAFNWYLKYTCNAHLSWFGDQLDLPKKLPRPVKKERRVINGKYRVYMNYCTLSYSMAWWDWKRWEREIDYMAMNGINMPLCTVGLSAVWYNTLLRFGYSDEEARAFLVGPAHAAWQWMQNIENVEEYSLPKSVIQKQSDLGKKIISRQLELGMKPIQQGFSGYVPMNFKEKYPEAGISKKKNWCAYSATAQLDPTDPMFATFGKVFLDEEKKLFGAHGFYAADPFHEGRPPVNTKEYLNSVGKAIHELFQDFDPGSTWVMQAWSIREFIATAVPKEHLLILDLDGSCKKGKVGQTVFWGYPVVTGILHNFGGRINMHGDLSSLASNPYVSLKKKYTNICGSGLFPEGIEQNPVYYELAFEMPHHEGEIDINAWLDDYATRRYGAKSVAAREAMKYLLKGPYRRGTSGTEKSSIVAARPALNVKKSGPNAPLEIRYDPMTLFSAQEKLLEDVETLKNSRPYRFDLVDVQRQIMTNLGQLVHKEAAIAFRAKDKEAFRIHSHRFLELLSDMDRLLRSRSEYNFDKWLSDARKWGDTETEKNVMERDATSLLTIWGPEKGPVIFDYAWREWSGLVENFYLPRWKMFYDMLEEHLENGTEYSEEGLQQVYKREAFRANDFYDKLADWELSFVKQSGKARNPIIQGDEIALVCELFPKYKKLAGEYYKNENDKNATSVDDNDIFENLGE